MPPKPNKKLDREKSRIMAALASTATPGTFETNFQALRAAHTENGTPAAIKSAFARLSPDIEKFITDINQLKAPAMQAILTDNDRTIISFAEERIGLSFKYNNQNELARSHFNEALAQNAHLGPFFNLMSIETSPVTIKKLREDLLDASCQPRHLKRDNYLTERLKTEANGLLDTYIAESSPNLKTYFKKHAPLLGINGLERIILSQQDQQTEEAASLRSLLFKYKSSHPKETTSIVEYHSYLSEQCKYYFEKKKYSKVFSLIDKQRPLFNAEALALALEILISSGELPHTSMQKMSAWLIELSEQHATTPIMKSFLIAFSKNKAIFNAKKAVAILERAVNNKDKEVHNEVHYSLGNLYYEGYPTLTINHANALAHFQKAANKEHVPSLMQAAFMVSTGKGTKVDLDQAFELCEKAHKLNELTAASFWTHLLHVTIESYSPEQRRIKLKKSLKMIAKAEHDIKSSSTTDNLQALLAKLAYQKAVNLIYMEESGPLRDIKPATEHYAALKSVHVTCTQNPEIIKAIQYAASFGNEGTQFLAYHQLGLCYLNALHTEQDLSQALNAFKQAILINKSSEDYDTGFDFWLLLLCSAVLKLQSERETVVIKKTTLQFKALNFLQQAISLQGEELTAELNEIVESLYKQHSVSTISPEKPEGIIQELANKFKPHSKQDWQSGVSKLETLLSNAPTPITLMEMSEAIETINERLLDNTELLPRLGQFVGACVSNAASWSATTILDIFQAVGRWHLSSASAALQPLFLYLQPHLSSLNFENCAKCIKFIGQCNFTREDQKDNESFILQIFETEQFKQSLNTGNFTAKDAARLLYGLAALDCNRHHPSYVSMAAQIFASLASKPQKIGPYEVSEIYHAYHYFNCHHNLSWQKGSLNACFEEYETTLCADIKAPSKTQQKIFLRLRQLYPDIQQEVFIKKAGRRVDFVIDGIIIQYNGARRHYVADDDGKLHRSVKERLALKTLKQVVCIDRATWNARGNNKDAEDDFLRGLIEKAKQDQAKKASSDEDEVIKPFFDRTAKEQVPVFHCRGSEEKKVAFA